MEDRKDKRYYEQKYYCDSNIEKVKHEFDSPLHRYRVRKVLEIYTPRRDEVVLDLGCAWGTFCFGMASFCKRMIGLDFSEKAVRLCHHRLSGRPGVQMSFMCADAQNTGLAPESVDVIISADLFEHLYPEQFVKVLDECGKILRKGGKLVIWTPHRGHFIEKLKNNNILLKKDLSHVDYKSMAVMIDALRQRRFRILKSYYAESHLPLLRHIEKQLLPFIPLFRRRIAILAEKEN